MKSSAAVSGVVPASVVTRTLTTPLPAGLTAVIWLLAVTMKLVAFTPPNVTPVTVFRFVPVITTVVPPPAAPDVGEIPVIVGATAV